MFCWPVGPSREKPLARKLSLRPPFCRFNGEIGDVVVGRITEVAQKRWRVDTQSRLDSVLTLASVNLPGGVLVRPRRPLPSLVAHTVDPT
jgi:exosome complex RNA-binding protein Rrp4